MYAPSDRYSQNCSIQERLARRCVSAGNCGYSPRDMGRQSPINDSLSAAVNWTDVPIVFPECRSPKGDDNKHMSRTGTDNGSKMWSPDGNDSACKVTTQIARANREARFTKKLHEAGIDRLDPEVFLRFTDGQSPVRSRKSFREAIGQHSSCSNSEERNRALGPYEHFCGTSAESRKTPSRRGQVSRAHGKGSCIVGVASQNASSCANVIKDNSAPQVVSLRQRLSQGLSRSATLQTSSSSSHVSSIELNENQAQLKNVPACSNYTTTNIDNSSILSFPACADYLGWQQSDNCGASVADQPNASIGDTSGSFHLGRQRERVKGLPSVELGESKEAGGHSPTPVPRQSRLSEECTWGLDDLEGFSGPEDDSCFNWLRCGLVADESAQTTASAVRRSYSDGGILEDPECAVCLGNLRLSTNIGKINGCSHLFCFECIEKWSRVTNLCPLCKQKFTEIKQQSKSSDNDAVISIVHVEDRQIRAEQFRVEDSESQEDLEEVPCQICGSTEEEAFLLLCDGCNQGYHTWCIDLAFDIPEGNWFCDECRPFFPHQRSESENNVSRRTRQSDRLRSQAARRPSRPRASRQRAASSRRRPASRSREAPVATSRRPRRETRHVPGRLLRREPQISQSSAQEQGQTGAAARRLIRPPLPPQFVHCGAIVAETPLDDLQVADPNNNDLSLLDGLDDFFPPDPNEFATYV